MPALAAVVFDLDDTLYPERAYVQSGFHAAGAWVESTLGLPGAAVADELGAMFDAGVQRTTFDRWVEAKGLDPAVVVPQMVQAYRQHRPRIAPYPGIPPLLRRLGPLCRLGVVTDGRALIQRLKLVALGLSTCWGAVVCTEDLGPGSEKPNPLPFRTALERLEVPPEEAIYVADNPRKDFIGARRAGLASVRLRLDVGLYSAIEPPTKEHEPDDEVRGFEELAWVLGLAPVGAT